MFVFAFALFNLHTFAFLLKKATGTFRSVEYSYESDTEAISIIPIKINSNGGWSTSKQINSSDTHWPDVDLESKH